MAETSNNTASPVAQLTEFAKGLSMRQRMLLGGGALLVAATLFVFVRLIGKPEMKPLYSGMKPADAQALGARLAAKNIKYEISPDGSTVTVPSDQLDASRLEVAQQGMPNTGRLGFELFDKPNWGGSDFSEKVNYQRALEGELERTIQTLNNVEAVRVHLVLPTDSIFTEREREAKAAVILKLTGGRLPDGTQAAITRLVASSVDKLRPENVTVVDAETNRPLTGDSTTDLAAGMHLDDQLAARVLKTLEPVVGADRLRATVKLEYDLTSSEEQQETYDPNTAVALTMQRSEERSGTLTATGVPGTASNVPGANGTLAKNSNDEGSQSSRTENGTYAVNRLTRHTVFPAGRLKRIATAVLVDDAIEYRQENGRTVESRRKRTEQEMDQLEELAKAAIGFDTARGDILSVQNLSFQSAPIDAPRPTTVPQRVRTILHDWSTPLRYGLLVLLFFCTYLLLLRPVKKQLVSSFRELPSRSGTAKTAIKPATQGVAVIAGASEAEFTETSTPEIARASALKKQVVEKVKAEPAATSRLIQSWIREGGVE